MQLTTHAFRFQEWVVFFIEHERWMPASLVFRSAKKVKGLKIIVDDPYSTLEYVGK